MLVDKLLSCYTVTNLLKSILEKIFVVNKSCQVPKDYPCKISLKFFLLVGGDARTYIAN